jgi:hypothetical protein
MKTFKKVLIITAIIIVPIAIYFGLVFGIAHSKHKQREATKIEMLKVEHPCPNGCKEIIEPWGGVDISGLMRFCAKNVESSRRNVKHGKWVVWVNTKVRIDGFYNEGKKDGRLTYYNNDGSTLSIVEYRNGVKVSEKQNEDI